jgi:hypothetical protein
VLPEEVIQFLLPAADTVGIPAGCRKDIDHVVHLGRDAILGYKEKGNFQHST